MKGDGIIYPPKWYDRMGKPLENLNAVQPDNPSDVSLNRNEPGEDLLGPENKPDEEITLTPPMPNDAADDGSGREDNAKSKEASGSEFNSGSDNSDSSSSSGSEDSSQDSASNKSGSGKGGTNSDSQSDAPRCKVRRKKKPHQSSNVESDEESVPKATTDKTGGNSDEEAKRTSHDSGLSNAATANPIVGPSGDSMAALLGISHAANAGAIGSLPLPTTLPSMATLEALMDDLEKFSGKLFQSLEETSIVVYDKVLQGFKDTSGKCKSFIHEMGSLAVTFFAQAKEMEDGLAKCDALAFHEAMSASKGHICGLIEEVAEAEVNFDSILASVAKEIKAYIRLQGKEQRKEYKKQCLARIKRNHGRLDGTCFIPMIVGNLTAYQALAMSHQVAQSHVPLKIMVAPLCTQAGTVKVYMKFVEFLARRVIALQERLGPDTSMVPLELESGGQLSSPRQGRSSSALPTRKFPSPSKCGSPA